MAIVSSLTQNEQTAVLTAIIDGEVYTAEKTHASWRELVDAVTNADENTDTARIARMFNPAVGITTYFERMSERVTVKDGHVYFDGEQINDGLANMIIRYINENETERAMALVNFLENVMTNPNEHSREQLFDWLSRYEFAINDAGNFIAYKGVYNRAEGADKADVYPYESSSSGRAIVDGQEYNGRIPNGIGAIVEMPRGEVQHDPSRGCHTGLHAGTWEYASSFTTGPCLLVEINPRDVVSVPTDCNWQKIRTCRYTVLDVTENKLGVSYWGMDELDYSDNEPYEGDEEDSWESYDTADDSSDAWGYHY